MLKTEQQTIAQPELPPKEDIERVAYCAGAYLSAFSKEPFDEKWSIDGIKTPGFLLNPKTTGEFVKEMLTEENTEIFSLPDGAEEIKTKKEIVLNHIDKTLDCSMTEYLFETEWFSDDDIAGLIELRRKIAKSEEEFSKVYIPYPLTSVLESYTKATKDPVSMVFLGYQEGQNFNPNEEVKFLRIQPNMEMPEGIFPRVVCRYVTSNHPRFERKGNVQDQIIKEVGYYLGEEELQEVKNAIDPYAYTIFFGELAKIPSDDKNLKMMEYSRDNYFNILITTPGEIDITYDNIADLIPTQMIFLSVRGTTVLLDGKAGGTKLFTVAKGVLKDKLNLDYEEKDPPLKFQNSNNQEVVIGIIKKIEK